MSIRDARRAAFALALACAATVSAGYEREPGASPANANTQPVRSTTIPLWKTLPAVPTLPADGESGYVAVNGARLYYAVFNPNGGWPVILLHGGLGNSEDWGFEVPRLARTHEVIVMDCRGRGRSTLGTQPLSYVLMASDVLGLMDALKIRKASIVGWSDGGIIGLILAIRNPDRVGKLLVFGALFSRSGYSSQPSDPAMAARYMTRVKAAYRRLSPTPDDFPWLLAALKTLYASEPELKPGDLHTIGAPTANTNSSSPACTPKSWRV